MSFKKWFQENYLPEDIPAMDEFAKDFAGKAYEAGQRDMRERAAVRVKEIAGEGAPDHHDSHYYAKQIRAIKLESEQ